MQGQEEGQKQSRTALSASFDRPIVIDWLIAIGAILLMTYLGPFGTKSAIAPFPRLIYWAGSIAAGYGGAFLYEWLAKPWLVRKLGHVPASVIQVLAITVSALAAVVILEILLRDPIPIRALVPAFFSVMVISIAIWGVAMLGDRASAQGETADCPKLTAFRERLPADLRGEPIRAIAAEDHYIRVFTQDGEALIAGRFADALDAVRSLDGTRTHRSWWAADKAVTRLERRSGNWHLVLSDGLAVPVSRNYRADIRARGWDRR